MKSVFLKQLKPQQATISGSVLLLLIPVLWYFKENSVDKILILLLIGLVLIGYSVTYEIQKGFENYKRIRLFGVTLWKQKLKVLFPEYISVFSTSFKKDNEWGTVAALGTKSVNENVVIKFFKGQKNEIVYKSSEYANALEKANELSVMLNVRVHDAVKNSST